jgi:hypothetical protein
MTHYINCYTWNDILPVQYIWEETCGYYALHNGNLMYKILYNINNFSSRKNYITQITKNMLFSKLISTTENINDINKLKKKLKKSSLSSINLLEINNYYEPNIIFNVYYNINDVTLILHELSSLNYIIVYHKKHWIPILIHKIDNQVNIHILDSYNIAWYGHKIINRLIDIILEQNKNYNFKIKCLDTSTLSTINMIYQKSMSFIYLLIIIYFLTNKVIYEKSN